MSWLESHQSLRDHPKKDRLAELLFNGMVTNDIADLAAIGILHCLWWWALDYAQDGDLTKFSDRQIAKGCGWNDDARLLVAALIDAGFVDKKPRRIHDWDAYAGRLLERREEARERSRNWRLSTGKKSSKRIANAQSTHVVPPTDIPTYIPKIFATQKTALAPVHNSKLPLCATCGSQMQYNGDGSDRMHCTICPPENEALT